MTALVAAVSANSVKMLHFLLDNGAHANVVHTSVQSSTGYDEALLSTALCVGATDCANELLRMETRPQYFDRAICVAARRGDVDFARLLLDIALPSTPRAFHACVTRTSCPLTLDLLLSRCSAELFDFAALNRVFPYVCRGSSAEMVSTFLAYGIDINFDNPSEDYPPLRGALLLNDTFGVDVATVLIENGVELIHDMRFSFGWSLLSRVEAFLRDRTRADLREYYEAGRDLLITHGILQ